MQKSREEQQEAVQRARVIIVTLKRRDEDMVAGRLSAERFDKLAADYDLIDKIVVHAPNKSSGHRTQNIEIYYKTVGIIEIPNFGECITAKAVHRNSKMTV